VDGCSAKAFRDNGLTEVLHPQCLHGLEPKRAAFTHERSLTRLQDRSLAHLLGSSSTEVESMEWEERIEYITRSTVGLIRRHHCLYPDSSSLMTSWLEMLLRKTCKCGRDEEARRLASSTPDMDISIQPVSQI
jgi:hypothetical protein